MIQFPETAEREWKIIADAANASTELRKRIERDTRIEVELERLRVRHEAALAFQQELDTEDTPELEMFTPAEYKALSHSAPRDLIDGVLTEGGLCTMLGPSGSGKSTKALQMLYCLATGESWLGQPSVKLDGTMGVLSFDMPADLIIDWIDGFPHGASDRFSVVNAYNRGNPLGSPRHRALMVERWKAMEVEAIVIDSFSASFFHQDQNDAGLTQAHYRDLQKFALTEVGAKALIVIVHSTDKSPNKARGSTVHKDTASTQVVVSVDEKTGDRRVHMEKYRAARGSHQMPPVIVTAPDDVTHLVDVNTGAMTMAGLQLPPGVIGAAFPDLPDLAEEPDTDTDSDEEEDL